MWFRNLPQSLYKRNGAIVSNERITRANLTNSFVNFYSFLLRFIFLVATLTVATDVMISTACEEKFHSTVRDQYGSFNVFLLYKTVIWLIKPYHSLWCCQVSKKSVNLHLLKVLTLLRFAFDALSRKSLYPPTLATSVSFL